MEAIYKSRLRPGVTIEARSRSYMKNLVSEAQDTLQFAPGGVCSIMKDLIDSLDQMILTSEGEQPMAKEITGAEHRLGSRDADPITDVLIRLNAEDIRTEVVNHPTGEKTVVALMPNGRYRIDVAYTPRDLFILSPDGRDHVIKTDELIDFMKGER